MFFIFIPCSPCLLVVVIFSCVVFLILLSLVSHVSHDLTMPHFSSLMVFPLDSHAFPVFFRKEQMIFPMTDYVFLAHFSIMKPCQRSIDAGLECAFSSSCSVFWEKNMRRCKGAYTDKAGDDSEGTEKCMGMMKW